MGEVVRKALGVDLVEAIARELIRLHSLTLEDMEELLSGEILSAEIEFLALELDNLNPAICGIIASAWSVYENEEQEIPEGDMSVEKLVRSSPKFFNLNDAIFYCGAFVVDKVALAVLIVRIYNILKRGG